MDIRTHDDLVAWIGQEEWTVESGNRVDAQVIDEGTEVSLVRPTGDEVRIAEIWFDGAQLMVRTGDGHGGEEHEAESLEDLAEFIQNEIDEWQ